MNRTGRAGLVLIALVATGCTATTTPPDEPDPVVQAMAPIDDPHADIADEVRTLDSCALLQAQVLDAAGYEVTERGMSGCAAGTPQLFGGVNDIQVHTWVQLDQATRYSTDKLTLGGAIAYRSSPSSPSCEIWLPVNFTHAIAFRSTGSDEPGERCAEVAVFAEAAATTLLNDPGALRRAAQPSDAVDACAVLEAAIADELPDGKQLVLNDMRDPALLVCQTQIDPTSDAPVDDSPDLTLELSYNRPVAELYQEEDSSQDELRTVLDTQVLIDPGSGNRPNDCVVVWDGRPAVEQEDAVISARLYLPDCGPANALLERAIPALRDAPTPPPTGEQVLIAEGEPDGPMAAPCDDIMRAEERGCRAPADVDPPADASDLLTNGTADTLCVAAQDAVAETFDRDFVAAVVAGGGRGGACEFVTTDHSLVVNVTVDVSGMQSYLTGDRNELTEVAGHPAVIVDSAQTGEYIRQVIAGLHEEGPTVTLEVQVWPTRIEGPSSDVPRDTEPIDNFDDIADDLVGALLGQG